MESEIRSFPLHAITVQASRYRLDGRQRAEDGPESDRSLLHSLAQIGLQTPLLVHDLGNGEIHLLDGFRRVSAIRELGWETVKCSVLPPTAGLDQVLLLLLSSRREVLERSLIARVLAIRLAGELGFPDEDIRSRLMPVLRLEAHEQVLKRCKAVGELPGEVLDFCDQKHFSLKQCFHLTRPPAALLALVFSWRNRLSLTASNMEELLENLKDHLRATRGAPKSIAENPELLSLLDSELSPHEKTKLVREWVRCHRFPVLTRTNEDIESIRSSLSLPPQVRLTWDETLEHRRVVVSITATNTQEWDSALKTLNSEPLGTGIAGILGKL